MADEHLRRDPRWRRCRMVLASGRRRAASARAGGVRARPSRRRRHAHSTTTPRRLRNWWVRRRGGGRRSFLRGLHRAAGRRAPLRRSPRPDGGDDPVPGRVPGSVVGELGIRHGVCRPVGAGRRVDRERRPLVSFYNGVPHELAEEALRRERAHPSQAAMEGRGLWRRGPTCRRDSCCSPTIASSLPHSCATSPRPAWEWSRMSCPADTARC